MPKKVPKKGDPGEDCAHCGCPESAIHPLRYCDGCRQVKYCSQECQKKNWKSHKTFCQVYSKEQTSTSEPALKVCDFCGILETHPNTLKACARCHKAIYCGIQCQEKHWKKEHKQMCQKIAQSNEDDVCPVCLDEEDQDGC